MNCLRFISCILILLTLHLSLSCNIRNSTSEESGLEYQFIVKRDSILSIKNNSDKKISIQVDINEKFANHIDDLIQKIHALEDEFEGETEIRKAWRFVGTEMDFFHPVSTHSNFDIPLLLYNSIGFGQCDDLSVLLHTIYTSMGYTSRLVNVKDHVVTEVMNSQKWEMYDPFMYVYYFNKSGQIASIEELSKDSSLILHPLKKIVPPKTFSAEKRIRLKENYSQRNVDYYFNVTPWEYKSKNHQADSIYIELPPYSQLELPVITPEPVFKRGVSGQVQHKAYVKYTLKKGWKGKFQTPFLISSIHGNGVIKIDHQTISIGNFSLKMDYSTTDNPPRSFEVIQNQSDIIVYCMLNENLIENINSIRITFNSQDRDVLSFHIKPNVELNSKVTSDFFFERNSVNRTDILSSLYEEYADISSRLKLSSHDSYNYEDLIEDIFTFFNIIPLKNPQERVQEIVKKLSYIIESDHNLERNLTIFLNLKNINHFIAFVYLIDEYPQEEILRTLINWQQQDDL